MHDVYYQETLVSPRTAADCLEAAGTVLLELGSRPIVEEAHMSGDLGSILKTRGPQMLVCPLSWLAIRITVDVREVDMREAPGQRTLIIGVGDRLPFQGIYLGRSRYSKRCQEVALFVRNEIDAQLRSTEPR